MSGSTAHGHHRSGQAGQDPCRDGARPRRCGAGLRHRPGAAGEGLRGPGDPARLQGRPRVRRRRRVRLHAQSLHPRGGLRGARRRQARLLREAARADRGGHRAHRGGRAAQPRPHPQVRLQPPLPLRHHGGQEDRRRAASTATSSGCAACTARPSTPPIPRRGARTRPSRAAASSSTRASTCSTSSATSAASSPRSRAWCAPTPRTIRWRTTPSPCSVPPTAASR